MAPQLRTVRVEERRVGDRVVLAVDEGDRRSFGFGERVRVTAEGLPDRIGIVSWDPVARWVVAIEEAGTRRVPW